MAFSVEMLPRHFAFLLAEFVLLSLDPAQLGNGEDTNCVQAHTQRSRNPHSAGRWIDTEMDVPDVLQDHIPGEVAQLKLPDHQYSCWALMIRKIRSTSAWSCSRLYIDPLM